MKLELKPDIEAGLMAQAHAHGLSLEAHLAEVLERASAAAKKARTADRKSLAQLFAESPLKGLSLTFERNQDTGRPVKL